MESVPFISETFNFKLGDINIAPTYWQAGLVVVLVFVLVWAIARIRYLYVNWTLGKSAIAMLFWGFLLALVLEGFLIIGGKTVVTEIIGWKNPPKPVSTALDFGRNKLVNVLGITEEIPESVASEQPTYQSIIDDFEMLSSEDQDEVRFFMCSP